MKRLTLIILLFAPVFLMAQYTITPKSLQDQGFDKTGGKIDSNATVDLVIDNNPAYAVTEGTTGVLKKTELIDSDSVSTPKITTSYAYRQSGDSLFLDSAGVEVKVIWPE